MRNILIGMVPILLLSGCVVPTGPVEVTRFNSAAQGEIYGKGSYEISFADANNDAVNKDSGDGAFVGDSSNIPLILSPFMAAVRREMDAQGYNLIANEGIVSSSDYKVSIRVRVNNKVVQGRSPVSVGVGGGTGGLGRGVGLGVGLGLGINLGGGPKERVITALSVRIYKNSDNSIIWEGRAQQEAGAATPAAQTGIAASKLAAALFSNFPGKNGETITVK